jgi:hypothetical protein
MKNDSKPKLSRRNFLIAVGAGGAAAAALASKTIASAGPEVVSDNKRGKGYQETAHVRSYYNTTKV